MVSNSNEALNEVSGLYWEAPVSGFIVCHESRQAVSMNLGQRLLRADERGGKCV